MSSSTAKTRIIPAMEVTEGAGVTVHRTIGTPALRNLDPFMLLDHISSDDPDDYVAGFPSHPHRGFNTFTYMIEGHMEHKDSMGNTGTIGPGDAQWMKAASGVIHSEMPKQERGLMRGFQLWINLPAANKMDAPEYQEYKSEAFPLLELADQSIKVVVGRYGDKVSPIIDDNTRVSYLDINLNANATFYPYIESGINGLIYVFIGDGRLGDQAMPTHSLAVLNASHVDIPFVAGEQGARILFISGRPIGEPIVQYGPFVMNSREEIEQAMFDFQSNNFVRDRAWINRKKKTEVLSERETSR